MNDSVEKIELLIDKFEDELSNIINKKYKRWFDRESLKYGTNLSIKNYYSIAFFRTGIISFNTNEYNLPQSLRDDCFKIFFEFFPIKNNS